MHRARSFVAIVALVFSAGAFAQSAPSAHMPPISAKSQMDAQLHALPQHEVGDYLSQWTASQTYSMFAGQNDALAAEAEATDSKRMKVGENVVIDLDGDDIFDDPLMADGMYVFVGSVTSIDAHAVRVQVDLSGLADGDEVYVVDPMGPRALGPYTSAQGDGWWLPTVEGDTAVLLARSATESTPAVSATGLSHHFVDMNKLLKQVSCNNLIACEGSADLQNVSTGIGRYTFVSGFNTFFCSGSLINNPDTAALEPYFLTANHCVSTQTEVGTVEVFWDYRIATCNAGGTVPSLAALPRSFGEDLLGTSGTLDGTLLELASVPSGALGRTFIGWTITPMAVLNALVGIHHPAGSHMRISYGFVTGLDGNANGYQRQIGVAWNDGVTEGGSSGSPILFNEGGHKIVGMLSNGRVHVCPENPDVNTDNYATFRHFFNENISGFLTGVPPTPEPPVPAGCPAKATLADYPELLKSLRALRDSGFLKTPLGQKLVEQYYEAAPGLAQLVGSSDAAKGAFMLGAGAAADDE